MWYTAHRSSGKGDIQITRADGRRATVAYAAFGIASQESVGNLIERRTEEALPSCSFASFGVSFMGSSNAPLAKHRRRCHVSSAESEVLTTEETAKEKRMMKKWLIGIGATLIALMVVVCLTRRGVYDDNASRHPTSNVDTQTVGVARAEKPKQRISKNAQAEQSIGKPPRKVASHPQVDDAVASVKTYSSTGEETAQSTSAGPGSANASSDSRSKGNPGANRNWPSPAKSRFTGKTIDYRSVELPPTEKGGKPGELREWLIEPNEGYTAHIEEEYRPDENGELQVVGTKEYVANQVVLTLDGETSFEEFKGAMERRGATVKPPLMELDKGAKIVAVMTPEINFDSVVILRETVSKFRIGMIAEEDPIRTVDRVPNDARYSSQWGLPKINAPEAWNIRTDASSVIVAVVDTGVNYNHQDIIGNLWVRNSSASATNFRYGMRASGGVISGNPLDDQGHGSNCAGIIGAVGNNSTGVSGVTWATKIMACKNLFLTSDGRASGSGSDMILCLEWARTNGAHIVSLSQGGGSYNSAEYLAFSRLLSAGIIAVCAAGNDGTDNDTYPHYPSSYSLANIVSVAATDTSDTLCTREKNNWSGGSNYGMSSVDIAAPGDNILSIYHSSSTAYASMSGTSQATPFVSGALALLKAQYPSYTYLQLIQKLYAGGDAVSALSGMM